MFCFSETWDCDANDIKLKLIFERVGPNMHYIIDDEKRWGDRVMKITKETDVYIIASKETFDDSSFILDKLSLAKDSQTFEFFDTTYDSESGIFTGKIKEGRCNVYEGKKVTL